MTGVSTPHQTGEPGRGTGAGPGTWRTARALWLAAAVIGVVGNGVNCLLLAAGVQPGGEFGAAVAGAALSGALVGLLIAVVLGAAWVGLAIALGRGWSAARWPLIVLGLVGVLVDIAYLAGSWTVLITSVVQLATILLAIAVMSVARRTG